MSPPLSVADICAVIVTYGERHHLLAQAVSRAINCGIDKVVVVYNGNFAIDKAPSQSAIVTVRLAHNLGSAGGYKAGLEAALKTDKRYLLLLDDDNLLAPDCLQQLCAAHARLGNGNEICLHAFRPPLEWHRLLLDQGIQTIARPNTYAWFHIANTPYLLLRQLGWSNPEPQTSNHTTVRESSVACYGGLLASRTLILKAGFPDPQFFCYYDDFEFSSRLQQAGARLFLCGAARIEDIEASWHIGNGAYHPTFSPATPEQRIFLDLRNAVFFCRARIRNRFLYEMNRLCFWAGIAYLALFRSPSLKFARARLHLIRAAARQGEQPQLSYPKSE